MPRMRVRTDEESAVGSLSAPMLPAKVPSVSPMPSSWEPAGSMTAVASCAGPAPLPALSGVRGAGARFDATPLLGALSPRALLFADMPDVMCCLPMASLAALLSIMGHGRRVQTGVPITHLNPQK